MQFFRTDLAAEALSHKQEPLPGVVQHTEQQAGVAVTTVTVETPEAAEALGKPVGSYLTIEAPEGADSKQETVIRCIAEGLQRMMREVPGSVLVVGLGNRLVTPDSLGPRTVEKLFVTRHICTFAPELAPANLRMVSAIAPGVLGVTGLETVEVVKGLVAFSEPSAVLCIDALASERVQRMTSVVQINDSGLLPGAGVGNRQQGLNREALGVPVFAIGVPTVVYASTIAKESVRLLEQRTGVGGDGNALSELAGSLVDEAMQDLVVTPKDVDKLVEDASRRLSEGINRALMQACYPEIEALLTH